MTAPLLIINGDDWGKAPEITDAILECLEQSRITGTTAMVHMKDSMRAASLGRRHGIPAGLHLNLDEEYTASSVPAEMRRRQARLAAFFRRNRWSRFSLTPKLVSEVRLCIADQLAGFRESYGRGPTHIDSHHHVHTSPSVLLSRGLSTDMKVRRTFTFLPGEKPDGNRLLRWALNRVLARCYGGTTYFMDLATFVNACSGQTSLFAQGDRRVSVEVMTHPAEADERDYLMSKAWMEAIAGFELTSYDRLPARGDA